jgi:hypothetical protein
MIDTSRVASALEAIGVFRSANEGDGRILGSLILELAGKEIDVAIGAG